MFRKMKKEKTLAWMMAIAIAGTAPTACNSWEPEKPFVICPVEQVTLYAYGVSPTAARSAESSENALFTDADIEWFDPNTRELRFSETMEPLREKIPLLAGIDFYLGDEHLFSGSTTCVGLMCSQVFDDLVLCCGKIDGEVVDDGRYYLYDCYPLQFINDERVQTNRLRRALQWEEFLQYLKSKGKLRQ